MGWESPSPRPFERLQNPSVLMDDGQVQLVYFTKRVSVRYKLLYSPGAELKKMTWLSKYSRYHRFKPWSRIQQWSHRRKMKYASVSSNHTLCWEAAGAKGTSSISAVKSRLWWRTESEAVNLKNSAAPGTNHNEAKLLQSSSAEETDRDTQIEGGRKYRRHWQFLLRIYTRADIVPFLSN